ncbi:uncharacterized protein DNG_00070 [Cephalotrichum gorgonifer]|uniref:Enoyl reductase (ER) domain-containing protein n=1 Tax=Cephalotrichum gorgonifer TaxID=2041049 RepID=A0AAE8MNA0_9PEZI|nr:uncharacterized protein DNG_00070 [Cephalotrichum gorgonifer]
MTSPTPPPTIPPTMRAWLRLGRGPAATSLTLSNSHPTPTVAPDSADVLVRVAYVALQFNGEMLMQLPSLPGVGAPTRIPEMEFSGFVAAAGSRVPPELREIGAHVAAAHSVASVFFWGSGAMAEYVKIPASGTVRLPDGFDMKMASGIACCGTTALKMLRARGVGPGDRVLVNGASSSVGSLFAQICKSKGATVVGVASGKNEELVRGLGVDEFVDYTAHSSLPAYLKSKYSGELQFDAIFDCIGVQSLFVQSPDYLKPSGVFINIGGVDSSIIKLLLNLLINAYLPRWLGGVPRHYVMFSTSPMKDDMTVISRLIDEGKVRVLVDSVWNMEDLVQAYAHIATKRARGKVVIKLGGD